MSAPIRGPYGETGRPRHYSLPAGGDPGPYAEAFVDRDVLVDWLNDCAGRGWQSDTLIPSLNATGRYSNEIWVLLVRRDFIRSGPRTDRPR